MIGNDYTQAAKNDSSYHFNDAFEYFAKGLEIRKLTLGETHPDTAWSYRECETFSVNNVLEGLLW